MDDKTFYIDHFSVYIIVFLFEKKGKKLKIWEKFKKKKNYFKFHISLY